jgi:hypothetical protein
MTLPTRIVECSFTGSDTSPSWVNITNYVTGISTSMGQDHELDEFGPGTMNLALIETGSRVFDPEYTAGAFYGRLTPNRPIRFRANWNNITYSVFRGYVDKWPQTYTNPGIDRAQLTATDGFKILARGELVSGYAETVLEQAPAHYYRLGDEDSDARTITDTTGAVPGIAQGTPTFGVTGLAAGGDDAAMTFDLSSGDKVLIYQSGLLTYPFTISGLINTTRNLAFLKIWFWGSTGDTLSGRVFYSYVRSGDGQFGAIVYPDVAVASGFQVHTGLVVDDGVTHHVAVVMPSSSSMSVYVDGADSGVLPTAPYNVPAELPVTNRWTIGSSTKGASGDYGFGGTVDEVAIWNRALTGTEIALQAAAVDGFADDTPGVRAQRILDLVNWPSSLTSITDDTGLLLSGWSPGTSDALSELRATWSDSEHGPMFCDPDGILTLRNRDYIVTTTESTVSQATFGDTASELPYEDIAFDFDDVLLRNRVTARTKTGTPQVAQDTTSIALYYAQGHQLNDSYANDTDVLSAAQYEVENHKAIRTRVSHLKVNPQTSANNKTQGDLYPQILSLQFGDRITVNRRPLGIGTAISKELLIEHIAHEVTADEWHTTYKGSPPPGEEPRNMTASATSTTVIQSYMILDNNTRGRLDYHRLGF